MDIRHLKDQSRITIVLAIIGSILSSTLLSAVYSSIARIRGERRREKIDLSREVTRLFHNFTFLLRELHETETVEFQAKREGRPTVEVERLHRRKDGLIKQFADAQGLLNAALVQATRVFVQADARSRVREFFDWYREQKRLGEEAGRRGEEPHVADFSSGAEIYGYQDRVIQALTNEIQGQERSWLWRLVARLRGSRATATRMFIVLLSSGILLSSGAQPGFGSKHWTIDPPVVAMAVGSDLTGFEPGIGSRAQQVFSTLVYDTLFGLSETGRLLPKLAESWSIDPTGSTLTVRLRRGVKFHDGSPFSADAVLANAAERSGRRRPPFDRIRGAIKISPDVVEFRLDVGGAASFMTALAAAGAGIVAPGSIGEDGRISSPIGTGPFRFKSHQASEFVSLPTFSEYWGTRARFNGTVLVIVPDPGGRLDAMMAGVVNVVLDPPPAPSVPSLNFQSAPSSRTIWLHIDVSQITSRQTRMAVAHGIDGRDVVRQVFAGSADVAAEGLFPSAWAGKEERLLLRPDRNRAMALLREAGGLGSSFTIASTPRYSQLAQEIARQLRQIGLGARVLTVDSVTTLAQAVRQRRAASWIFESDFAYDLPSLFSRLFVVGGDLNWSGYSNAEITSQIDSASKTARLPDMYSGLNLSQRKLILNDMAIIPLVKPKHIFVTSSKVQNFSLDLFGIPHLSQVTIAK